MSKIHQEHGNRLYFLTFLAACTIAFWAEWVALFQLWGDAIIYSHGFVVLAALLYLLYLRRQELSAMPFAPSPLGLMLLFGCCMAMLLAKSADIITARLLLLPFLLITWGWSLWGWRYVQLAGRPIALLIFAVPIWDDFSPIFQQLTVWVNDALLKLVHIQATISEFYITIPNGTFHVAGGCSGVRYLMSGLFLASLYGILYLKNPKSFAKLIALAGGLSIVANWIRVFGVIIVGYKTNMQSSMVHNHEVWGWIIFVIVALIPLFYCASRLEKKDNISYKHRPVTSQPSVNPSLGRGSVAMLVLSTLLALSVPTVAFIQNNELLGGDREIVLHLPAGNKGWQGPLYYADFWKPDYVAPDVKLSGVYVSPSLEKIEMYMLGYHRQKQGKELIYYHNKLYATPAWQLVSQHSHSLPADNPIGLKRIEETVLRKSSSGEYIIVWSWFQVGDYAGISKPIVKIVGGLKRISGDSGGALIAIASTCRQSSEKSCMMQRDVLTSFAKDLLDNRKETYVTLKHIDNTGS